MQCPSKPVMLILHGSLLLLDNPKDPLARAAAAAMIDAARALRAGQLTCLRNPCGFNPTHLTVSAAFTAICAFAYALAQKAVLCQNTSMANTLLRMGQMVQGASSALDPNVRLSSLAVELIAKLIRISMTVRWVIVGLSLSFMLEHAEPWMKVVKHLSTYLQDAGISMFVFFKKPVDCEQAS